jgi:hypothetical protein
MEGVTYDGLLRAVEQGSEQERVDLEIGGWKLGITVGTAGNGGSYRDPH